MPIYLRASPCGIGSARYDGFPWGPMRRDGGLLLPGVPNLDTVLPHEHAITLCTYNWQTTSATTHSSLTISFFTIVWTCILPMNCLGTIFSHTCASFSREVATESQNLEVAPNNISITDRVPTKQWSKLWHDWKVVEEVDLQPPFLSVKFWHNGLRWCDVWPHNLCT